MKSGTGGSATVPVNASVRNNIVNTAFGELYHANAAVSGDNATAYNGLSELGGLRRGTLSASSYNGGGLDTVTTLNPISGSSNAWTLDALGNPTATGGATQSFNAQNQITAITGKTTPLYAWELIQLRDPDPGRCIPSFATSIAPSHPSPTPHATP